MDISNGMHSDADMFAELSKAVRTVTYQYVLAEPSGKVIGDISITDGKISYDSKADVMRTFTGTVNKTDLLSANSVDYRLIPYLVLEVKKEKIKWPLGCFIIDPSYYGENFKGKIRIKGYDLGKIALDTKTTKRFFTAYGGIYTSYIAQLLGECYKQTNIPTSDLTRSSDMEWEPGISYLSISNTLLEAIGYTHLFFNEVGIPESKEYVLPQLEQVKRTYSTTDKSIILDSVLIETNAFDVPNKYVRYTESVDAAYLYAEYTNDKEEDPYSVKNRGRVIVDSSSVSDIATQENLNNLVQKLAIENMQSTEQLTFYTLNIPGHGYRDCLYVSIQQYNIDGKYIETGWEMELKSGGRMMHRCEKVVSL